MEYSFATFSQSKNNSSPAPSTVSDMEYYAFHNIDRMLFRRLIGNQGRCDPKEAIQIMGFWIWLEREVVDNLTLVSKMLDFQMKLVNDLCDEAITCLRCVASETYPFSDGFELSLMPVLVQKKVTYKYFYQNRVGVVQGVAKMVKEVCVRAFRDILEEYARENSSFTGVSLMMSISPYNVINTENAAARHDNRGKRVVQDPFQIQSIAKGKEVVPRAGTENVAPFVMPGESMTTGKETRVGVQQQQAAAITPLMIPPMDGGGDGSFFSNDIEFGTVTNPNYLIAQPSLMVQDNPYQGAAYGYCYPYYVTHPAMQIQSSGLGSIDASAFTVDASAAAPQSFFSAHQNMFQPGYAAAEPSPEIKQDGLDSMYGFSHIFKNSLTLIDEEDDSPDERTIFLTFSRGYPISANEVKEFFTKKFGNFIESIHMQEVPENEQVMFARVIARSPEFVNAVVEGGRAKYNINGKHMWARKFVRNKKSPSPSEVTGPSKPSFVFGALKF